MQQGSQSDAARSAPARVRGAAPDAGELPEARGRWVALTTLTPRADPARSPGPIVLRVSRRQRARSWAIDPGLVAIFAIALAAIGLGALDGLLFAVLMRLL